MTQCHEQYSLTDRYYIFVLHIVMELLTMMQIYRPIIETVVVKVAIRSLYPTYNGIILHVAMPFYISFHF